jgi:DNA-binding NtrC family response regulator
MSHGHALIVDDEVVSRQVLRDLMVQMNFSVTEADSGRRAIENIKKSTFDIVISDLVMPEIDGLQLLRHVKKLDAGIPFLMVTGYPSVSGSVTALKQGASGYLTKPFTPEKLQYSINQAFEQKFLADPLGPAKGSIVGLSLSVVTWMLIVLAIWASFQF